MNAFATMSDAITTVALSTSFVKAQTGIRRTDRILQKLLLFVVTRGMLVSVVQVAMIILCLVQPEELYWYDHQSVWVILKGLESGCLFSSA